MAEKPRIRLRGVRSSVPPGYVLGRTDPGNGDVQLIPISMFDDKSRSTGASALNAAKAYADAQDAVTLQAAKDYADAGDAATLAAANSYTNSVVGAITFPVTSVFGRTGAVTAQANDYSISQINGAGALASLNSVTVSLISDASANGRSLISAADYAAMKTLLAISTSDVSGLGTAATKAASNNSKTTLASVNTASTGFFARFADNSGTVENSGYSNADFDAAGSAAAAIALSCQRASNLSDVANAGTARSNLGLAIGTNVQAYDATLQSLSALGTAANKFAYTTGIDTWAEADITAAGRAILDDADAAAQRTTLGLAIGTNVQAYDATLQSLSALGTAANKFAYTTGVDTWAEAAITAAGRALIDDADAAAQRTTLGLVIGTDVQAYNANTAINSSGSGSISHANIIGFTEVGGNASANYYYVRVGNMVTLTITIQGVTSVASTNGTSYIAAAAFPAWTLASPSNFSAPPAVNNATSVSVSGGGSFNGNFWMSTFSATANIMVQTVAFQVT